MKNDDAKKDELTNILAALGVASASARMRLAQDILKCRVAIPPGTVASTKNSLPEPGTFPLYERRRGDPKLAKLNAIDFLKAVWGPYIEAKLLFANTLNRLDPKLLIAVRNRCNYLGIGLDSLLPVSQVNISDLDGVMPADLELGIRIARTIRRLSAS